MDVKGKNCIVTGVVSNVGLACTRELLKQGAQKLVIMDDRQSQGDETAKKLQQEFGKDKVVFVKCDVSKHQEVETALRNANNQLKQVDLLVNCQSILNEVETEKTVLTNLNGTIQTTQHCLKFMGKDNGGRGGYIVNVASILGLHPLACCPTTCATNRAIINYTRCLALPFWQNKTGIKLMTLCPGITEDDLDNTRNKVQTECTQELQRELMSLPRQDCEQIGQALIQILTRGENGAVFVCEGNQQPYEIQIPNRDQIKRRN